MKTWEISIPVPYIPIIGWILISSDIITLGSIGGIFAGAAFPYTGVISAFLYTTILVIERVLLKP